ncbi:MAG TPA: hypothetical protein VLI92_03890 [Candidatus Saccharimonadales bacterium]|nr:hypothetical protein [Candidatus Saccharimonadales bacterium]
MENRETLKNQAIEKRESGNLQEALELFKSVEQLDISDGNVRGQLDILGHIRITYSRLAEEETDLHKRKEYRKMAMNVVDEAITVGEQNADISQGALVIQKVHLASSLLDYSKELANHEKQVVLETALKNVEEAVRDLPGSKAHKSWPCNTEAQILLELGQYDKAFKTAQQGETWLFEGYDEEVRADDQAEMKLNVWLSGLHLTMGRICAAQNKKFLARQYAVSVLAIEDHKNTLHARKHDAQKLLDSLK